MASPKDKGGRKRGRNGDLVGQGPAVTRPDQQAVDKIVPFLASCANLSGLASSGPPSSLPHGSAPAPCMACLTTSRAVEASTLTAGVGPSGNPLCATTMPRAVHGAPRNELVGCSPGQGRDCPHSSCNTPPFPSACPVFWPSQVSKTTPGCDSQLVMGPEEEAPRVTELKL